MVELCDRTHTKRTFRLGSEGHSPLLTDEPVIRVVREAHCGVWYHHHLACLNGSVGACCNAAPVQS